MNVKLVESGSVDDNKGASSMCEGGEEKDVRRALGGIWRMAHLVRARETERAGGPPGAARAKQCVKPHARAATTEDEVILCP